MTNHFARLYALAGTILVFLLTWAVVAAHPWQATSNLNAKDPRLTQLAAREQRLRHEQVRVQKIVDRRWARYRKALAKRKKEIAAAKAQQQAVLTASVAAPAAAPPVHVVTLPPLTSTKSS
jgi:hypothetical protein